MKSVVTLSSSSPAGPLFRISLIALTGEPTKPEFSSKSPLFLNRYCVCPAPERFVERTAGEVLERADVKLKLFSRAACKPGLPPGAALVNSGCAAFNFWFSSHCFSEMGNSLRTCFYLRQVAEPMHAKALWFRVGLVFLE